MSAGPTNFENNQLYPFHVPIIDPYLLQLDDPTPGVIAPPPSVTDSFNPNQDPIPRPPERQGFLADIPSPIYDNSSDSIFNTPTGSASTDSFATAASLLSDSAGSEAGLRAPCELPSWMCRLDKAKKDIERYLAENQKRELEKEVAHLQTTVNTLTCRNIHLEQINRHLENVNAQHARLGSALTVLADMMSHARGPIPPYFPPLPAPLSPIHFNNLPPPSWPTPPNLPSPSDDAPPTPIATRPRTAFSTFSRIFSGGVPIPDSDSEDSGYDSSFDSDSESEVEPITDDESDFSDVALVRAEEDSEIDADGEPDDMF